MAKCTIAGCSNEQRARGWCATHWSRWRRTGDPLGSIPRQDGPARRYFQEVVLPYGGNDCLFWPFARNCHGVAVIRHEARAYLAARLACEETHGAPPTPLHEAAHNCGNGHLGCVNPKHLRWATHAENMADTLIHGTRALGERCGSSKLTESDVVEIRSFPDKVKTSHIANLFGMSQRQIRDIRRGKAWSWLEAA